ncbi:MAG: methionine synthase [Clostridiaceae bacterium]|nr:methionine synthase [Clostridiaceae bacterium]
MKDIKVMKSLKPQFNKNLIYTRLGYRRNTTRLNQYEQTNIDYLIDLTENTLNIVAAYRIINILRIDPPYIVLEDQTCLKGKKLSKLLTGCDQALIMFATGGQKIIDLIVNLQKENRLSDAVVVDAAASEITDSALDIVMAHVAHNIRPLGQILTDMRFSPGYGDFDLSQQAELFRILDAEKFGVSLNEAFMLTPEKSVFAVAGIGRMKTGGIND